MIDTPNENMSLIAIIEKRQKETAVKQDCKFVLDKSKIERLKMYRNLNEKELQWINRLLDVEFQGRDILRKQLSKAKIIYIQEADSAQIDADKIELERVEYEINQEV